MDGHLRPTLLGRLRGVDLTIRTVHVGKSRQKPELWQEALCDRIVVKLTLRHFCLVFCLVAAPPADGEDATILSTPLMKRIISSTSLSLSNVADDVEPTADDE